MLSKSLIPHQFSAFEYVQALHLQKQIYERSEYFEIWKCWTLKSKTWNIYKAATRLLTKPSSSACWF